MEQRISKRQQRIAAAKARPAEETAARRKAERAKPVRNVKLDGVPRKMVGGKLLPIEG